MVWKRVAAVIVAGCLTAGCMQQRETPKAAAPVPPMDPAAVASLEQSWRATHPGSMVGHVDAVDPSRHVLQVTDLPIERVHDGDVFSILPNGQSNNVVTARVYDKRDGFIQMDYGPLQAGQNDPHEGDLALWFGPGLTQAEQEQAANGVNTPAPATQPAAATPETPASAAPAPAPATPPAETAAPAPPATTPATPPAAGNNPAPAPGPPPPPPDLNK